MICLEREGFKRKRKGKRCGMVLLTWCAGKANEEGDERKESMAGEE